MMPRNYLNTLYCFQITLIMIDCIQVSSAPFVGWQNPAFFKATDDSAAADTFADDIAAANDFAAADNFAAADDFAANDDFATADDSAAEADSAAEVSDTDYPNLGESSKESGAPRTKWQRVTSWRPLEASMPATLTPWGGVSRRGTLEKGHPQGRRGGQPEGLKGADSGLPVDTKMKKSIQHHWDFGGSNASHTDVPATLTPWGGLPEGNP